MENEKPNFEEDLWGQCNILHERLGKKIDYYKNLRKTFEPIFNLFGELNKKINSMKFTMDPTIHVESYCDSETNTSNSTEIQPKWYGIPLTMKIIKEFISNSVDFNNQALFHVVTNLEKLINKMKQEKSEYEDFQKSLNVLSDNKKVMEKNMKLYHTKMFAAEQSVLDLKKMEVKNMSINNDATIILESKDILVNKANELLEDSIRPFKIYKDSVNKTNELREESINIQKKLLYTYQEIEEEIGKINKTISNLFFSNLKFQKEFIEEKKIEIEKIKNNINIDKDIRQLIIDYKGNDKPEEVIPFNNFSSMIDFDKSDNNETFQIYTQSIAFIKEKNKEEYPNYNEQLELDKNDMREITYKLFSQYSKDLENKLLQYIKNTKTHTFFLILLSKLRTNNRFKQNSYLIDLLGIILNDIINVSEKNNNYDHAKNCIILSQTFYCEKNNEKYYLFEKIRNHKWLVSNEFWFNFIDKMISQEIDKFIINHPEITKEQILNCSEVITDKMKYKLSELLFSQLLPYVNNMNEFKLELKNIVQITEAFFQKYNFVKDEHKESIFGILSDKKEEIEKLRKESKNKNTFINNNINNSKKNNNNKIYDTPGNSNNFEKNINNNKINNTIKITSNNDKNTHKSENENENHNQKKNLNNNIRGNENIVRCLTIKPQLNNNYTNNELFGNNGNMNIQKNNDKKANNKVYDSLLNVKNNFVNIFKKEDKKEDNKKLSSDNKKDVKEVAKIFQEETKLKKESSMEMKKVMLRNSISSSNNPFGVVLKKVPTLK